VAGAGSHALIRLGDFSQDIAAGQVWYILDIFHYFFHPSLTIPFTFEEIGLRMWLSIW
jgi:hypothetical protein